ncbi:MAG TPA: vitamin B12 dependent methionine synthase [Clostridiales bacterium]|nr:vitamin B12 dependent methionine synthase [Clostridiales bacterium]
MDFMLLDNIKVEISNEELFKSLKIDMEDDIAPEVLGLFEEAWKTARPKAVYGAAYIEDRGRNWVVINGIRFTSRILSVNLKDAHRVFPYVVTCGRELYEWAMSINGPLERYWADTICEIFLRKAFKTMSEDFIKKFNPGKTATMNPGSLEDWPISEQKPLFSLIGDDNIKTAGIELTESFLMIPVKSMSGIKFLTEYKYENCMLCPRERCPGRRAEYDSLLKEKL